MNNLQTLTHSIPPPAFLCTQTRQVMEDPVINLCSHLFDRKILPTISHCPVDLEPLTIDSCIPLNDLKNAITNWKTHEAAQNLLDRVVDGSDLDLPLHQLSAISLVESLPEEPIHPLDIISNAHQDDIHGMISSRSGFITGSKDTTVKMWKADGSLTTEIKSDQSRGYQSWITALHRFTNDFWAYGTRDGSIFILNQKGEMMRSLFNDLSWQNQNTYKCKDRNRLRINCITELFSNKDTTQFYVGTPKYVQLWDGQSARLVKAHSASPNDWVYCVETLPNNRLGVVYGSTLQVWKMPDDKLKNVSWNQRTNLIVAPLNKNYSDKEECQREHLSSIVKLHNQTKFACAVFDGSLRVVDIPTQQTLQKFHEHKGRAWSVVKLEEELIASSADDRTIKIWDLRIPDSIRTIVAGAGRVSSLLVLNENTLLSGSCPDNVFHVREKATVSFWDLRILSKRLS